MGLPVKTTAVHDHTTDSDAMSVHVLGRGVGNDVTAPFDRAAVDRRGKGIVDDQRNTMTVCDGRKLLDIEDADGRIGDGLAEDALRVRAEAVFQLFFADVRIDEGAFDAHLLHRYAKQIVCPAVDRTGGDEVIAGLTDVEYGKEIGCLAG